MNDAFVNAVFSLEGEIITRAKTRDLLRVNLDGQTYYIKRYWTAGKRLRAYFFRSRARAEWENLQYFKTLNIPAPEVLAFGEYKENLKYKRGAFKMAALKNVQPLDERLTQKNMSKTMRLSCLKQIAEHLRVLHDNRFVHGDCFVRNFLVSDEGVAYFTDCPRGRHYWGPFLDYGKIRDLASFYKGAMTMLSLSDQFRFFLWYRKEDKLTKNGRKMLKKISRQLFKN